MDQLSTTAPVAASPLGPIYTIQEVAAFLRVSDKIVQIWIRDGKLAAFQVGRLHRIRETDLLAFVDAGQSGQPSAETDTTP